jgi:hypothetical protein
MNQKSAVTTVSDPYFHDVLREMGAIAPAPTVANGE